MNDLGFHVPGALAVSPREPLSGMIRETGRGQTQELWAGSGGSQGGGEHYPRERFHAEEFSGLDVTHQLPIGLLLLHFVPIMPSAVHSGPQPLRSLLCIFLFPFTIQDLPGGSHSRLA